MGPVLPPVQCLLGTGSGTGLLGVTASSPGALQDFSSSHQLSMASSELQCCPCSSGQPCAPGLHPCCSHTQCPLSEQPKVCPRGLQLWEGARSRAQGTLLRALPCAPAHLSFSILGSPRPSPQWPEDPLWGTGTLQICGSCSQHWPGARPVMSSPPAHHQHPSPSLFVVLFLNTKGELPPLSAGNVVCPPQPRALLIFKPAGVNLRYKTKQAN